MEKLEPREYWNDGFCHKAEQNRIECENCKTTITILCDLFVFDSCGYRCKMLWTVYICIPLCGISAHCCYIVLCM